MSFAGIVLISVTDSKDATLAAFCCRLREDTVEMYLLSNIQIQILTILIPLIKVT